MTDDRVKLHYCCINMKSLLLPGRPPMHLQTSKTHVATYISGVQTAHVRGSGRLAAAA